jgi:hypothetical protein
MTTVKIIVASVASAPGRFTTKLADGNVLVVSWRTPFLDAAPRLLKRGCSADAVIVMRHAGSAVESLRATIGKAAPLTVTPSPARRQTLLRCAGWTLETEKTQRQINSRRS